MPAFLLLFPVEHTTLVRCPTACLHYDCMPFLNLYQDDVIPYLYDYVNLPMC